MTKWQYSGPWYRRFSKDARRNLRAAKYAWNTPETGVQDRYWEVVRSMNDGTYKPDTITRDEVEGMHQNWGNDWNSPEDETNLL